jgi:hypothetical protein
MWAILTSRTQDSPNAKSKMAHNGDYRKSVMDHKTRGAFCGGLRGDFSSRKTKRAHNGEYAMHVHKEKEKAASEFL